MRTLEDEPKVLIEIEESWAIVLGFPTPDNTIARGQLVKLNADGTVSKCAATTDRPIGHVASAYKGTDAGNVRVMTHFVAHYTNAYSDGVTDEGQLVACSGVHTDGTPKFKVAATGDFAIGMVTKGGANATGISVGLLRMAQKV
jgi:hypothetical protein